MPQLIKREDLEKLMDVFTRIKNTKKKVENLKIENGYIDVIKQSKI